MNKLMAFVVGTKKNLPKDLVSFWVQLWVLYPIL